jgi:Kef-type K+ transport system membrane component KefB
MKKTNSLSYLFVSVAFTALLFLVFYPNERYKNEKEITDPKKIESLQKIEKSKVNLSIFELIKKEVSQNLRDPLSVVLIQIVIILIFSRMFSLIFKRMGQPSVIGEIFAGIALGPSLVGFLFPEFSNLFFPKESLGTIKILSQIGLLVFMFIIGMELDVNILKKQASSAIFISHMSIIFPYALGVVLALFLFEEYAPEGVSFLSFGLFMGIAMSITAFPVLARIIQERGLSRSNIGVIAITCAAVDDITAWCILAVIIAIVNAGTLAIAFFTLFVTLFFVGGMLFYIQPLLNRMSKVYVSKEIIGKAVITSLLLIVLISALFAEGIGIHALFGAFIAGVIMPTDTKLRQVLTEKFEDFSMIFLLPLFFAYTGIRTKIGLLNEWHHWVICFLIISVATLGKLVGSMLASRYIGNSWRDSFAIGVLMNTRGLMELIVLNIGYDLGVISPKIFVMMVIMALVTTFITGPLLSLILKDNIEELTTNERISPILIAFGPTQAGVSLLKLAYGILGKNSNISALHLSPIPENLSSLQKEIPKFIFEPLEEIAELKKINLHKIYKYSDDIVKEISTASKTEQSSIVLMGAAKRVFGQNILGGKVEKVLSDIDCTVGIFLDKNLEELKSVGVFYSDPIEFHALLDISSLIYKQTGRIEIIQDSEKEPDRKLIKEHFGKQIPISSFYELNKKKMSSFSLVIIGYKHWLHIEENLEKRILFLGEREDFIPSIHIPILIIRG